MKKAILKTVAAATIVAAAMALSSVAAFAATHTLTADGDGVTDGETFDNGYFTAVGAGEYKKSNNVNTFVLTKKGGNYIKFTTEGNATVKVSFASTGGSNTSYVDLCDESKASLEQHKVDGTTPQETTYTTALAPGKTYIVANLGTEKDTRLASITVEETGAANYPNFELPDTDTNQDVDLSPTASKDANITGLAVGDTTGTVEDPSDSSTLQGFKVIGSVSSAADGTQSFKGMTIEGNGKTYEGESYKNRLKTNGVGSTDRNCIVVEIEKDSTIEAIGMSGNNDSYRPIVISNGTTELASHVYEGGTMSKAVFSVTPGTYYLYAGPHTNVDAENATDGGINLYSLKVYDGVSYKLPVVELTNSGLVGGKLHLTASVNDDYTAGPITGIGFILAKPDAAATTEHACTYYTINGDTFTFIGELADQALKAQAYVEYTSEVDQSTVRRYSNTVVNVKE